MIYLPRFFYYIFLFTAAIFIASSNILTVVLVTGIFFYLPISLTVWAFSTIYEKIFKSIDRSIGQPNFSINLKIFYITIAIALLLITIGIIQESTRIAGFSVAAALLAIEQLIGIRERRMEQAKHASR